MAYDQFDRTHPVITDTRQVVVDEARYNLNALADAIVAGGQLYGYNYSYDVGAGDKYEPAIYYWKNGNDWIRSANTWGTTGGEDGNPTVCVFSYSDDAGSTWETIGTLTFTWDADGVLTSTTWS